MQGKLFRGGSVSVIQLKRERERAQVREFCLPGWIPVRCAGTWVCRKNSFGTKPLSRFKVHSRSTLFTPFKRQCSIVNYDNHARHYVPQPYLSCNWQFIPFQPLCPLYPLPTPCLQQPLICTMILGFFCFCLKIPHISEIIQHFSVTV